MRTPGRGGALALIAAVVTGACSVPGLGTATSPSPVAATSSPASSPSGSASPAPATNPLGVLFVNPLSGIYTVSLVGIDGRVVASAQANRPVDVSCANAAGAVVPMPLSTSNTRVYFMDDKGVVRFLTFNGDLGRATTVPVGTPSRRSFFAVSPDDRRIAVIVSDFTASGVSIKLYVEDLNGGTNHLDIFSSSGAYGLWPIGWHGTNNLVVAVVPSCTQGGGPFCCGIQELHVVDPATAIRRFTIGGVTACPIVGPASPAGAICWDGSQSKVLNWSAVTVRTYPVQGPELQYLSPNGGRIALVDSTGTSIQGTNVSLAGLFACTWIDDAHVLAGGDNQQQPRVGDVTSGKIVAVPAQGDCAGRIPGGL